MAASTGDKVTDTRNAARPNSARVSSGRSAGGTTLACDNLAGWPTASKVHFVTYTIDSNSNPVAGTQLDCSGIVSGNNIGSFTVIDGTDTGNSVNDVVEMLPTAAWGQDLADALTSQHTRTGTHKSITNTGGITTDTLTVSSGTTLPAGDIVTADLADAGVTSGKMQYGMVRNRQGGTSGDASWQTTGTTTTDTSAKAVFWQVGSRQINASTTISFPTAYSQVPLVTAQVVSAVNANAFARISAVTTTGFTVQVITADNANGDELVNWMVAGQ